MKNQNLYYLALPYQGSNEEKAKRTHLSMQANLYFLKKGISVFAPILYVNQIAEKLECNSLDERRAIIMPYLLNFLLKCAGMFLIEEAGWDKSWGVQQEVVFCVEHNIPIFRISPEEIEKETALAPSQPLSFEEAATLLEDLQRKSA